MSQNGILTWFSIERVEIVSYMYENISVLKTFEFYQVVQLEITVSSHLSGKSGAIHKQIQSSLSESVLL